MYTLCYKIAIPLKIIESHTPILKWTNKHMLIPIISSISIYQITIETPSCGLLTDLSFDDFAKLSILLYIKKGNQSIFYEFWLKVYYYLFRFLIL